MKKIISLLIVGFITCSIFAQVKLKSDLDVGLAYGFGFVNIDKSVGNIKIKDVTSNGPGLYFGGTVEFNKYLGFFGDLNFLFPVKTSINTSVNGIGFSLDDLMKVKFVMTDMIGLCGIIPVSEKFKVRLGGGLDVGLAIIKMEMSSNGYDISGTETDFVFGLGLKAVGVYMIKDWVGINFGLNADFYFTGVANVEYTVGRYKYSSSSSISGGYNFIRPQVGATFRF